MARFGSYLSISLARLATCTAETRAEILRVVFC